MKANTHNLKKRRQRERYIIDLKIKLDNQINIFFQYMYFKIKPYRVNII